MTDLPSKESVIANTIIAVLIAAGVGAVSFVVSAVSPLGWWLSLACTGGLSAIVFALWKWRAYVSAQHSRPEAEKSADEYNRAADDTVKLSPVRTAVAANSHVAQPKKYNKTRGVLYFLETAAPVAAMLILLPFGFTFEQAPIEIWLLYPVVVLVGAYFIARARALWHMRPIKCGLDGIIEIYQTGAIRWLALNSDPDTYQIDKVDLITPSQSLLEQIVFRNSQTLVIVTTVYRHGKLMTVPVRVKYVRDVKDLRAIQRWRAGRPLALQEDLARNSTEILGILRKEQ